VLLTLARPPVAIALFVFAMALIPFNDALIKLMSDKMSIFQILALRAALSLTVVLLIPTTVSAILSLRFKTWLKLILRGMCLVGAMLFFFLPLAKLSLAEVTAIFFTAPLLISLLSIPVLGEQLGAYRLMAVLIGMSGVLFIVKPGTDGFQTTYLIPLASSIYYAVFQIITRFIRNEAPLLAMVAVQNIIYFCVGVIGIICIAVLQPDFGENPIQGFLLRPWHTPQAVEIVYLTVCGLIVLTLAFASTNVYSNVEATFVSPFEYVALPMAVLWGIVLWGDWPDLTTWIGICLIVTAGIFLVYREHVRSRNLVATVPMRSAINNSYNRKAASLMESDQLS